MLDLITLYQFHIKTNKDFNDNIDLAESLLKVMTLTPAMMMIMMMRCGWGGKSVLETADVPSSATNRLLVTKLTKNMMMIVIIGMKMVMILKDAFSSTNE